VVVPTFYLYREKGKLMAEEGQMTFVLSLAGSAWKVRGWTWTVPYPHPSKWCDQRPCCQWTRVTPLH
jgi:hypothetical protein